MALEWLKTILGDSYTEEIEKGISKEIGKQFVAKADFNSTNEAKKALEAQLADRDNQLEELKKVDATKLQAEITRLQTENTTAKNSYQDELAKVKLNSALDVALMSAKARDVKAVKPFLDMDLIKLDGDKLLGLDEQLKTIKTDKDFLFEPENSGGIKLSSGMSHQGGKEGGKEGSGNAEVNAAFRSFFGQRE